MTEGHARPIPLKEVEELNLAWSLELKAVSWLKTVRKCDRIIAE
ncbi:hypothetical protein H1P_70067 [Hyella patelloides LEGE 07179]|uniref:Uncharacterized protein n=1 Tax=Hyella patelloides LEGE 07179 TaxID=945734 RepID=A0A563W3A0_9CYAN|nr:hypothetical protein [Hyella patelloides]VEP18184.1 hypothetical protein H1P_70067 [Hyella patelloides LEGE 07179]